MGLIRAHDHGVIRKQGKRTQGRIRARVERMEWLSRGRRPSPASGMVYRTKCRRYMIAKQDQCLGIEFDGRTRWIAIRVTGLGQELLSRHYSQKTAKAACEADRKSRGLV